MTDAADRSTRAIARDVVVQVGGRVLNLALGVVVTALVARTLGNEGYGQWVTIFAVVSIATEVTVFGFTGVAVRQAVSDKAREGDWIGASAALQATFSIVIAPVAVIALVLLADETAMQVAGAVIALLLLLTGPLAVRAIFQLRMRNEIPVAVTTLNSLLWAGGVFVLAATDAGLRAFAVTFVAIAYATAAVEVAAALRLTEAKLRPSRKLWGPLARIGVPIGVGSLLIVAYARVDQIMVFELAGEREAGLYGAAYRILDQAHFIPLSLITTIAPITAAAVAAGDIERLRRVIATAARFLLMAALGALAVAVAVGTPALAALFGEDFREAGRALPPLVGAFVFMSLGYLSGNLVLLYELQRRFVITATIGLAVNVGLNLLFIPRYGFVAAAWTTLVTEVVVVVPTLAAGLRRMGGTIEPLPYLRAAAAAALLGLALAGLERAGAPVGVSLAVAGPLYVGLLLAVRAFAPAELRELRKGA